MTGNMEQYKVFYYVAKSGSVSQAAEQLFISQPAVSQSVRLLENTLGCSLFIRTSKGVRLTAEGEKLFSYVSRGYEEILEGERKLREMLNLESGEIRIGASDMTLKFYLLPYLEDFRKRYPKVKITVSNAPTPETINTLKMGRIDFGVVSSPIVCGDGIKAVSVGEIQDIFVAGTRFSELKNRRVDISELSRYPLICLEKNTSSTRRSMDGFMEENGVVLSPEIELATSDLIVEFAERNLGIGAVSYPFAKEAIEKGSLFRIELSKEMPLREICVVTNERASVSAAGKELLGELLKK